jgi:glutamate-1-semialdehyde 2,1-aminomutase
LLVSAGSGVVTLAIPGCSGVPESIAANTLIVPFNDLVALEACFKAHPGKIAGFIVEPVCGNMGVVLPEHEYLQKAKELCHNNDALLIFDEVMTGFRACFGGVSKVYDIQPDLTCLGKIVGGGMPLAVYGGLAEIMSHIAPDGPVYQAGTLSGNPLAVAAGLATLKKIEADKDFYKKVGGYCRQLESEIKKLAARHAVEVVSNRFGSMMTMFFNNKPVKNYKDAASSDCQKFAGWFRLMLDQAIYLAPSQFESAFVSVAHSEVDLQKTLAAADIAFSKL